MNEIILQFHNFYYNEEHILDVQHHELQEIALSLSEEGF